MKADENGESGKLEAWTGGRDVGFYHEEHEGHEGRSGDRGLSGRSVFGIRAGMPLLRSGPGGPAAGVTGDQPSRRTVNLNVKEQGPQCAGALEAEAGRGIAPRSLAVANRD